MDLFDDLPEPTATTDESLPKQKSAALPDPGKNKTGLFADLPPPDGAGDRGEKRKFESQDAATKTSRHKSCVQYQLKGYVADRKGEREEMQDAYIMLDNYLEGFKDLDPSIHRLALYGVFDGHNGARASRFASQNLYNTLRDRFPKGDVNQVEKEIRKCLVETFKKTDEDFLKLATKSKPTWKDGTTAILVLVINDTLFIANLGDSKAVLCRHKEDQNKCVAVPLSTDHSPSMYDERIRIQRAGGHVREGRVMGILEVSRSLGDGSYKNHGVICIPDVKRCHLTDSDRFIMIACDGLWKSFTLQESIDVVNNIQIHQTEPSVAEIVDNKTDEDLRFESACSRLATEAVFRLSGDNVTIIIVAVKKVADKNS